MRRVVQLAACAVLVGTACARQVPSAPLAVDERSPRWTEWAGRVESLPVCLPLEWEAAMREAPSFEAGDTVHVRGHLGVLELDCSTELTELMIRGGLSLPDTAGVRSLRELDDAVALAGRLTCGSMLGLRVGPIDLAIELPLPRRVWRENDAELFDSLLAQTDAIVVGVVEGVSGRQAFVQPTRVCRAPGPPLELVRPTDDGERWRLADGLEFLASLPTVPRVRRAQALRVLFDVTIRTDPARALRAAERLAREFDDRSRLGRTPR